MDFRQLIGLKDTLFDCPDLTPDNTIPVAEFRRILAEHDNEVIKDCIGGAEEAILKEIQDDSGQVCLNSLSDLVDLFVYLPVKGAKQVMSKSPNLYAIMTSGSQTEATFKVPEES